tara:strand:- start:245 stop:1162 length:918 start_codon:yes stop_codon:yes gene_type:complete
MKNNKVVVFGGSGFLGSHVADTLTNSGYDVTIFDRIKSPYINKNQKMVIGNIIDQKQVRNVIKDSKYVYHFAGIADIHEAMEKPIDTVKYNILPTTYILDACREYNIKRFIYASTIYVYSDLGSFYTTSKQTCELLIANYKNIYNVDYTILRFGSLYGKRANDFNSINKFIKQALLENKIEREGDGQDKREYINVLDAAQASVRALDKKYTCSCLLITGQEKLAIKEVLDTINEIFGNKIVITYKGSSSEEHYKLTPYSFCPMIAKKVTLDNYYDFGQGILDIIHEMYDEFNNLEEKKQIIKPPD